MYTLMMNVLFKITWQIMYSVIMASKQTDAFLTNIDYGN
jgi:hypothetical protein